MKNTGTFTPGLDGIRIISLHPFYWDGISNILINTCSLQFCRLYLQFGLQPDRNRFLVDAFTFMDGSPAACKATIWHPSKSTAQYEAERACRWNGNIQNSPYDYPAPYGNWYWGARHQMLILASELTPAGLTAGNITSLAFNVVSTDPTTVYDYIDIHMRLVSYSELPQSSRRWIRIITFIPISRSQGSGRRIYLFSPAGTPEPAVCQLR